MDCIRVYHSGNLLTIRCDVCDDQRERQRKFTITQSPEVMIIHLARNQMDEVTFQVYKEEAAVQYPEDLDLSEFNEGQMSLEYQLYGVIGHDGTEDGGHYVAAVRHSTKTAGNDTDSDDPKSGDSNSSGRDRDDPEFSTISDLEVTQSHDGTVRELLDLTYASSKFPWTDLVYVKK